MTRGIREAIAGMSGPEVVVYLGTLIYAPDPQRPLPKRGSPNGEASSRDPGLLDLAYQPGTWGEIEELRDTGVIDIDTYTAAMRQFLADKALALATETTLRRRRITYRRDPDKERHQKTGSLPAMVCKGLLRERPRRPYVVAWSPGAVWALNGDQASQDVVCQVISSVGLGFPPTPTSADVRLDLDDPLSVAACVARTTTMQEITGGPVLGPPLAPGCVG